MPMPVRRRRHYAGSRMRALRRRLGLSQAALAPQLGISVSYLSQIENDERPVTGPVLVALAREFPADWTSEPGDDAGALMVATVEAGSDASVAGDGLDEAAARRAAEQSPQVARRMVALHAAYRRSLDQLRMLDDKRESGSADAGRLPWEEARDWFQAENNYIDPIDRLAEDLAEELMPGQRGLEERLARAHGIRISVDPAEGDATRLSAFDKSSGSLSISPALPSESRNFLIAQRLVKHEFGDAMRDVAEAATGLHPATRELLAVGLANYAAGALLMPYGTFREAARETRHDIDRLCRRFGVSFEQACHRLSTLQRPGAAGLPFFFCRVDMAGNITKRHSATRLQFARFGGACPLWVVHEAVAIPDRILVQLAELPDGTRYVSMAKGLVKPSGSFLRSPRRYAVALGCEERHARDFVYADALHTGGMAEPIGTSCRICPRPDCDQRAFPPAASIIEIDPDVRTAVPYRFR